MTSKQVRGFTIVELIIVIIVVAILASVVIIGYNGFRANAVEASLQSDLSNAASQLESDRQRLNGYPSDPSQANNGNGLATSEGNTFSYVIRPYGFCVSASNPKTNKVFNVRATDSKVNEGNCAVTVSTIAGTGWTPGSGNGNGTAASFYLPQGIAIDSAGNLFIADSGNHRIRKITPAGDVSNFAGTGVAGFNNGPAATAQFNNIYGMDIDSSDNLYVADSGNNRIRKITPSGDVSTFAGSGTGGFLNGSAATARFSLPGHVAVSASGDVYVADGNYRVRKITATGDVSTYAGTGTGGSTNGPAATAQFNGFGGIAVDKTGNVYVSEVDYNPRIRKITPNGIVSTLAGSSTPGYADGTGTAASFNGTTLQIKTDKWGNLYAADGENYRIRMITPAGVVTTLAGTGDEGLADGVSTSSQFVMPFAITVDDEGVVYLTDNHRVRKIVQ